MAMSEVSRRAAERALRRAYRETGRPIWRALRDAIRRTSRSRMVRVNVGKINRLASDGDVVVVPGKVLGMGAVDKRLTVAALAFSAEARRKIESAGGRAMSLEELASSQANVKGVRLIGG